MHSLSVTNSWSRLAPMIKPRCGHGLIAHAGYLYAIGGWVGLDIGPSVERYDFESGVWNLHDKTATPRFAFGAMEYEGNKMKWVPKKYLATFLKFSYSL